MNHAKPDKTIPILVGGAFLGVLSGLPFISVCCCLWALGGGALATLVYTRDYPTDIQPPTLGDGALLGLLAGLVGTLISTVISVPLSYVTGNSLSTSFRDAAVELRNQPDVPAWLVEMVEGMGGGMSVGFVILSVISFLLLFSILGAVGGIIGMAIFKPKGPGIPPSGMGTPPPAYPPSTPLGPPPAAGPSGLSAGGYSPPAPPSTPPPEPAPPADPGERPVEDDPERDKND